MTCLLVDANNLICRLFFAGANVKRSLAAKVANAPEFLIFVFDGELTDENWRRQLYPEYKQNHSEKPDALLVEIEDAKRWLHENGILVIEQENVEADDAIASLTQKIKLAMPVEILSNDGDFTQLIDQNVTLLKGKDRVDEARCIEMYGLEPTQMLEYKALMGDSSDNISGVPGIGKKKAATILQRFETVRNAMNSLSVMNKGDAKKLEEGIRDFYLAKELIELDTEVKIRVNREMCRVQQETRNYFIRYLSPSGAVFQNAA